MCSEFIEELVMLGVVRYGRKLLELHYCHGLIASQAQYQLLASECVSEEFIKMPTPHLQ